MITRKIKYYLIIILLLISTKPVLAQTDNNIVDFSKKGTITITLKESNDNTKITGASLTIYQIANAVDKNHNLAFEYQENIIDCQADLTNLSNNNLANEIDECITNISLPTQTKLTDGLGTVTFDNLNLGLYLVKQTNKVAGYSSIEPFLIMIPQVEDNNWIYNINAKPKTDIISVIDLSVEKVWNNSSKQEKHPESITVELYKGEKLLDTITLNEQNNWTHTWKELEKSNQYQVLEINIPKGYVASYRQEGNKFIITNTKSLVQTGANVLLIELLLISGIIFVIIGIICEKRKKYE